MPPPPAHRISTPSRLHLTLIDMNGEIGRIDGSLGLSLQRPGLAFDFGPNERTVVRGGDAIDRRVTTSKLQACSRLLGVAPEIEIAIREMIPRHQGLGSGTQLRLAMLAALNHRFDLGLSPSELSAVSTRGGTSGVGINAFFQGGLLLDGGHSFDSQKTSFAPSRHAAGVRQPPLLARYEFPAEWGIVVFVPEHLGGLSGQEELDFMVASTPLPIEEVRAVSHTILMGILPAVLEMDLEAFGSSVDALQQTGWKRCHWSRPDVAPLHAVRSAFNDTQAIVGCGLSSTGAAVFGFFDAAESPDGEVEAALTRALREHGAVPGHLVCTRADNTGMKIDRRIPARSSW
ncbi:MAG: hypothetical protein OXG13_14960 [Gemmatimonadaceae bacterium]|nr:hypothetical protein [Gemmatimonadaceae bacterium]